MRGSEFSEFSAARKHLDAPAAGSAEEIHCMVTRKSADYWLV